MEVSCPHFVHALATYYLILPAEASTQPRQVRRDALRPAGAARGRRRPERRGGHARHPRRGLRRRGEAPHHPRHLRAVQRLLRRLLRPGPEGPHPDRARLRGRVRAGRRAGLARPRRPRRSSSARSSTTRWRCTSTTWPPSRPTSPACRASRCPAAWPTRTACRPASRSWPRRSPTTGSTASAPRSRPCSRREWGGRAAGPGPGAGGSDRMSATTTDRWSPSTRRSTQFDPALGLEVHVELNTAHQDVLRLPDRVRRRAQHPDLPDLPRACPARCRRSTRKAVESRDPDRARAQLRDRRVVPVRPEELLLPGHAEELPDLASTTSRSRSTATWTSRCDGRDRSGSRSSAPTWRRTPASRCTSAAPPAGSTGPTTPWSTTTAPASR